MSLPPRKPCAVDDCDDRSWARGMCSRHYSKWRREQGLNNPATPVRIIGAIVQRPCDPEPISLRVKVRVTVGPMTHCPGCSRYMTATSPTRRYCLSCGTTAVLNAEEVSWVISEKRSTAASTPTRR